MRSYRAYCIHRPCVHCVRHKKNTKKLFGVGIRTRSFQSKLEFLSETGPSPPPPRTYQVSPLPPLPTPVPVDRPPDDPPPPHTPFRRTSPINSLAPPPPPSISSISPLSGRKWPTKKCPLRLSLGPPPPLTLSLSLSLSFFPTGCLAAALAQDRGQL